MKKGKVFIVALALLVLMAGVAQAEMYVEGYLGGVFPATTSDNLRIDHNVPGRAAGPGENFRINGAMDPQFQGGVKLGAWFERSGVLSGINFPTWAKYLGFYFDFSYHRLDFPNRRFESIVSTYRPGTFAPFANATGWGNTGFSSEGTAATLAFMFAFRYGFFPDTEVPFGRLQPYFAIGPAILFSSQTPTINAVRWAQVAGIPFFYGGANIPSSSSTDIALALEAGVRWMCLKNVSVDVSFKWRHANPTYEYDFISGATWGFGSPQTTTWSPTYDLFSVQVGAAYHF